MSSAHQADPGAAPSAEAPDPSGPSGPVPIIDRLPPGPRERLLGLVTRRELDPGPRPADALGAILASDNEVAGAFLPRVMETIAARVEATRDQLLDLFRGAEVDPWGWVRGE